jgi:hypothetical protein
VVRNDNALSKLSHLPTTQCACVDFGDFAKQHNGGGCEKDWMYSIYKTDKNILGYEKPYTALGL